jgi:hypothetical protein
MTTPFNYTFTSGWDQFRYTSRGRLEAGPLAAGDKTTTAHDGAEPLNHSSPAPHVELSCAVQPGPIP